MKHIITQVENFLKVFFLVVPIPAVGIIHTVIIQDLRQLLEAVFNLVKAN